MCHGCLCEYDIKTGDTLSQKDVVHHVLDTILRCYLDSELRNSDLSSIQLSNVLLIHKIENNFLIPHSKNLIQ